MPPGHYTYDQICYMFGFGVMKFQIIFFELALSENMFRVKNVLDWAFSF